MLKYLTILFIALQAINTPAAGLNALENFLKSTQSGKAEFSQVDRKSTRLNSSHRP